LLAAALLLPAATAVAQTLDDVVARNLLARGGLDKLRALAGARMTGRISFGIGGDAPFTLERKRPRCMRAEFVLQGARGIQAFDGKSAWTLAPGEKTAERLDPEETREVEDQADFDGPLVDWKAKGHTLELLGKQSLGGAESWKLKLVTRNGNLRTIFLDAASYLEVRIEGKRSFGGGAVEVESALSDYRDVAGIKLPFRIESGPKGVPQRQRIVFDKIEIDVAIDDARFRMPGAQ
jgi:hypothetical protein